MTVGFSVDAMMYGVESSTRSSWYEDAANRVFIRTCGPRMLAGSHKHPGTPRRFMWGVDDGLISAATGLADPLSCCNEDSVIWACLTVVCSQALSVAYHNNYYSAGGRCVAVQFPEACG